MSQKVHPKGFRLVTTQKHLSKWYGDKLIYPSLIEEDFMIREKINYTFSEFLSIAKVEINRINQNIDNKEYVNVTIHALFPRAKEMYRKVSKYFTDSVDNSNLKTIRPKNMSMDCTYFEKTFNVKLPTLEHELINRLNKNTN